MVQTWRIRGLQNLEKAGAGIFATVLEYHYPLAQQASTGNPALNSTKQHEHGHSEKREHKSKREVASADEEPNGRNRP